LLLTVIVSLAAPSVAAQVITLEGRLVRTATWETRVEVNGADGARVFGLEVYDNGELVRAAAGVSSRWIVAGPVDLAGLMRLLEDPFASGPAGDAHTEATGLVLDSSYEGPPRRGVWLRPIPDAFAVGAVERGGRLTAAASAAGRPLPGLRWEALAARSAPEADPAGDAWYADEPPWPGGALAHGAMRVRARAGGVEATLAAASCAGERAAGGGWALLRLHAAGERLEADALAGAAAGDYRGSDADLLDTLRHAALRLAARSGPLAAWVEGSGSLGRLGARAVAGEAGVEGRWRCGRGASAGVDVRGGWRSRRDAAGLEAVAWPWEAAADLRVRRLALEAGAASSGRASAAAAWTTGPCELRAEARLGEAALTEAAGGVRVSRGGRMVEALVGWAPGATRQRPPAWLSIGWRVTGRPGAARAGSRP
jgi:hypothetical protein